MDIIPCGHGFKLIDQDSKRCGGELELLAEPKRAEAVFDRDLWLFG
jgi:hypothetical protein